MYINVHMAYTNKLTCTLAAMCNFLSNLECNIAHVQYTCMTEYLVYSIPWGAGLVQVICGNPVRALRQRKKQTLSSQSTVTDTFSPSHEQQLLARVHGWRLE